MIKSCVVRGARTNADLGFQDFSLKLDISFGSHVTG